MKKSVYCMANLTGEEIFLTPDPKFPSGNRRLDLGSGIVGASSHDKEYTRRQFARTLVRFPEAAGKVGVYLCPFAFADKSTFELVEMTPDPMYVSLLEKMTKYELNECVFVREEWARGKTWDRETNNWRDILPKFLGEGI